MTDLPTGTLTFLFTDIEGSTRLWEAHRDAMRAVLARHDALLQQAISEHRGRIFKSAGDSFCAVFAVAPDALAAALSAQRALRAEPWPDSLRLGVRMAVHTGSAELRDADYFGEPLNRLARLLGAGHGGQTLVSEVTKDLCSDLLPAAASLKSLGEHALRDLARRERVFQLVHPELPRAFPPLNVILRPAEADVPSIAVLPFVNLSRAEENEYFADGLAEELLTMLSKVRGLRVASRTSAFWFKGKDADLATVAQKLNVATVLEGSVRKAGNRIRITAQLIQVATDSHLWSETYDRELTDIFAVQDDIARSVVAELRAALLGEMPTVQSKARTAAEIAQHGQSRSGNPEAYRLYLQGKFLSSRHRPDDLARGGALLREALVLEPDYALAWVGLARVHRFDAQYSGTTVVVSYANARAAVQRALELAPDLVAAHIELAAIRTSDWDWAGADVALARALELAPNDPDALAAAGNLARIRGRYADAIALAERAVALDPLDASHYLLLGVSQMGAGRLDRAERALRTAIDVAPGTGLVHARLARLRLIQGRHDEALAFLAQEPLEYMRLYMAALIEHAAGRPEAADRALEALLRDFSDTGAFQVAMVHAFRGETDAAFEWLERAYAQRDHGLHSVREHFHLRHLHADPRWPRFLAKMGLAD
jgi:TolB-like protein/class 3 adenylate cyclase/Flp pilus assembly protein TadD